MSRLGMGAAIVVSSMWLVLAVMPAGSQSAIAAPAPTPSIPDLTGKPSPEPRPSPTPEKNRPERRSPEKPREHSKPNAHKRTLRDADSLRGHGKRRRNHGLPAWVRSYRATGGYSTAALDMVALRLRALGLGDRDAQRAYLGFPIGGPTSWTDSWGAPRHEFGRHYRRHEGQDLFCNRGAPVLATETGRIEFDTVELGGKVARLYREDGSYWYYAHLSGWNTEEFSSGDLVRKGDRIGACGTTGSAVGTPPHVHFGWYSGGLALNPIGKLLGWLESAQGSATRILKAETQWRIHKMSTLIAKRRSGEGSHRSFWCLALDPPSCASSLSCSRASPPDRLSPFY